jgi:ABC-type transport system substrate-binding protein
VVIAAALTVLAAAACGSDADSEAVDEAAGDPVRGGSLVIGLEAETDGFDPRINRWATSGQFVAQALFDTLAMFDVNGEPQPYLAATIEPNDDFTVWVIGLREGVTFHDGTPLDADAVALNLEQHRASPLSSTLVRPIEAVEVVDPLTVRVTMSEPWSSFPVTLAVSQVGYVAAPAQLENNESAPLNPIGTGPFMLDDWTPDSRLRVVRNPDYWQEGLPYLDEVEFRPIIAAASRDQAFAAGDIQMLHTYEAASLLDYRDEAEAGEVQYVDDGGVGEELFVLLNTQQPPVDDLRVRRAMAQAIDLDQWEDWIGLGVNETARSPFSEATDWYSPEAVDVYPGYDPNAARALVDEYEAENGPIVIDLQTQPVPTNVERAELLQVMWDEVGIETEINSIAQDQFINGAVLGNYTANLWRQFGALDPAGDTQWWDIDNAAEIGAVGLNFARNRDPDLQAALDAAAATGDPAVRRAAYDDAQVRLNEMLPYLWLSHTVWALVGDPDIENMAYYELPDGTEGMPLVAGWPGTTKLTQTCIDS